MRARYYDPATGRFLNRDIAPYYLTNPVEISRYLYAAANPITNSDPSGHTILVQQAISYRTITDEQLLTAIAATGYATACLYTRVATYEAALAKDNALLLTFEALYPSPHIIFIYPVPLTPNVSRHMWDAIHGDTPFGPKPILLTRDPSSSQKAARRRAACSLIRRIQFGVTGDCDEYPFASTFQGGGNASIRSVPWLENRIQGGFLGWFYRSKVIPSLYNDFVMLVSYRP